MENGIFDLLEKKLIEHSSDFRFLSQIPVIYDPEVECPVIDQFLSEIIAPDDIRVIFEIIGYCLYRSYPIQKAIMFIGEGSNGKSTLAKLIKIFLGSDNCAAHALQDFENFRFATADLYQKNANIFADIPATAVRGTGVFKMLTGGDPIRAEKKFKSSFIFDNYAKLIFSANRVPATNDDTNAFFRRWVLINFPNTFERETDDTNKLSKITTGKELSGLFNKAVKALETILKEGAFSISKTTDDIRDDYVRKSDPVAAFTMDCIEADSELWVGKDEIYRKFAE